MLIVIIIIIIIIIIINWNVINPVPWAQLGSYFIDK